MLPRGRPRAESVVQATLLVVVSLLVLPPIIAITGAILGPGANWEHVAATLFRRPQPLINTLVLGFSATAIAVLAGSLLALLMTRAKVPGGATLEQLIVLPLYMTPLLTAIAWSWLGSPRGGALNLLARALFGPHAPTLDLATPAGVIAVTALTCVPLPFLLVSGALRSMDPSLEECARVHGANAAGTLLRITLRLVLPAMLASSLLVFVQAIGMFSVPAVLGMPGGYYVATTEIYRLLNSFPARVADASIWGLFLMFTTGLLLAGQSLFLGRRSFATMTGKAFRPRQDDARWPALRAGLAWTYVTLAVILPCLALIWAASIRFVTADPHLMQPTLAHFTFILREYPKTWIALGNSVMLGAATASIVALLGLGVSWIVLRTHSRGRMLLDQISLFPLSMPSMVFALGLLWVYVGLEVVPIYGTIWILLLAYASHYLPYGVRASSGALRQLHPELEEAARVGGATWGQTMRRITLPLLRTALASAWLLLFVMAMQEVSASILLYSSSSIVLSVAAFDIWEGGNPGDLAALGVLQMLVTFTIVGLVMRARRQPVLA
jgi:iron(III) transport system permease protein